MAHYVLSAFKGLQALNLCFRLVATLQGYLRIGIYKKICQCHLTNETATPLSPPNRGKFHPDTPPKPTQGLKQVKGALSK